MILSVCIYIIEIIKYYLLLKYLFKFQERRSVNARIMAFVGILLFSVYTNHENVNIFIVFVLFVIFEIVILFKDKLWKKVLLSIWLMFFVSMMDVVFDMFIELIVYLLKESMFIPEKIVSCLTGCITVAFICFIIHITYNKTRILNNILGIRYCAYLSVLAVVEGIVIGMYRDMIDDWGMSTKTYILGIIMVLILMLNICMVVFLATTKDRYKQMHEMNVAYMKMQEQQYLYVKELNRDIRQFKHDYTAHINTLKRYIDEKKYDDANIYINKIAKETHMIEKGITVGNGVVDAILNQFLYEAGLNKINFNVMGGFENESIIDPYDNCIIFSNLMKNAMDAAKDSDEKYITVSIEDKSDCLEIMVINSFKGDRVKKNDKYYTTKGDNGNYGWGINNIKASVDKYKGECEMYDEDNMFVANIKIDKKQPNL